MSGYLGFEPLEHKSDFYFVSYNNEDSDRVGILVRRLHEEGVRIWYDKGLTFDEKWEMEIAQKIRECGAMLLFITAGVLQKEKSFVRKEYQRAKKMKKKIYVAILDRINDEDVPDHSSFWWDDVQEHQGIDLTRTPSPHEQTGLLLDALGVLSAPPIRRAPVDTAPALANKEQAKEKTATAKQPPQNEPPKSTASAGHSAPETKEKTAELAGLLRQQLSHSKSEPSEKPVPPSAPVAYSKGLAFVKRADGTYAVSGMGTCQDTDVKIPPATPQGGKVTAIGKEAFKDHKSIRSVTIPDGVVSIGKSAFWSCEGMTSVTIPKGLISMESYAFIFCRSLTAVTIPGGVETVGDSAFSGCKALRELTVENGVRIIGKNAFENCESLTAFSLPASVKKLEDGAFGGCGGLTEVSVPHSLTAMGINPFANCSNLKSITVSANNPTYYSRGNCVMEKQTRKLIVGLNTSVIPDDVTAIGCRAFYFCRELTAVTLPRTLTVIGENAFCGCEGLKSVTLPAGLRKLGGGAFDYCSRLRSVVIPSTVTEIGSNPFSHNALTSLTVEAGNGSYYSQSNAIIERKTQKLVTGTSSTVIPHGVKIIGNNAFSGCDGLTSVVIPSAVTTVEHSAFQWCRKLTSATVPKSVTKMGNWAFSGCSALTVYCEHPSMPADWEDYWNSQNRPVVWGHKS